MEKKCSKCAELQKIIDKMEMTINLYLDGDPTRQQAAQVIVDWMKARENAE